MCLTHRYQVRDYMRDAYEVNHRESRMIRNLTPADLPAIKSVIDATGLFPSDMLDDMVSGFFSSPEPDEHWLVLADPTPVGVAYVAPEKLTDGTWNLYLIAIRPDRQGRGNGSSLIKRVEEKRLLTKAALSPSKTAGAGAS